MVDCRFEDVEVKQNQQHLFLSVRQSDELLARFSIEDSVFSKVIAPAKLIYAAAEKLKCNVEICV